MTAYEVNFDGLVGPTHNYGGLSMGNVASMSHGGEASNPKAAALQGLQKMRALMKLGLKQGVLPPHERPFVPALRKMGFFTGTDADVIAQAAKTDLALLRNMSSAAAMWTANAATVSPSADTPDKRVHFTPANLTAMAHRSIEHPLTGRVLKTYFPEETGAFAHHDAVPVMGAMGDEGAANHGRMAASHGEPGAELFVYGRSAFERLGGWNFLPRQAGEASEAIARHHGVDDKAVYIRQSREAIEAGAFHNDVVSVANANVLLYHEKAFESPESDFDRIRRRGDDLGFEPIFVEVSEAEVPLSDAIRSYLFNSQLITLPDGRMALILPGEAETTTSTRTWVEQAIAGNSPIAEAHYFDLNQSMKNGGGPACLRLRVVLTDEELGKTHAPALLDEAKISALESWVEKHYRDRMTAADLADPALLTEVRTALDELSSLLDLGPIYDFQR
ncbi:N-succinylarginine dihydrolase [Parvularcula marina]|uniref:N-succinylarginine dihydrolase n=1 Tax=Parvularcula marina TaxID=2292771 RepID=A0A371RK26_9PROT|nr:N-succinylarginine dihydrolase [Parvularcula marina]RFB05802.1 N-succinylarginine dihydrolase [Parvularcula marina]